MAKGTAGVFAITGSSGKRVGYRAAGTERIFRTKGAAAREASRIRGAARTKASNERRAAQTEQRERRRQFGPRGQRIASASPAGTARARRLNELNERMAQELSRVHVRGMTRARQARLDNLARQYERLSRLG